jgi:Na+/glutamate symporter
MVYYNSNDYCNAISQSGGTSDYMHMAPIYGCLQGRTYDSGFGSSIYGYGYGGYNLNTADKIALGVGAIGTIFAGIGMGKMAKAQAQQQQQMQLMQYQQYQQQSAQVYQQQQQQQAQQSMMEMLQLMLVMKQLNANSTPKSS